MNAAPSELTIGNLVRRVLFFIREEYVNQMKYATENYITLHFFLIRNNSYAKVMYWCLHCFRRETGTSEAEEQQTASVFLSRKQQQRERSGSMVSTGSTGSGNNVKAVTEATEQLTLDDGQALPATEAKEEPNITLSMHCQSSFVCTAVLITHINL